MIYIVCPTCGFFIGSHAIEYDKKKAEICANSDLTEEQQADEIQKLLKSLTVLSIKKLLNLLDLCH